MHHRRSVCLVPIHEPPGTAPVLRRPRTKTGRSPSPSRFAERRLRSPATFLPALLGCLLLAGAGLGCSQKKEFRDYVPQAELARRALEVALTCWQQGQPSGSIEAEGLKIQADDYQWRAGRKLRSFEVLEEVPETAGAMAFRVRLTLEGTPGAETTTYYVLGQDPLSVCRDKDFARLGEM